MSGKRERESGEKDVDGKAVKTRDDEESQTVRDIAVFCAALEKQSGPQLLVSIRKVSFFFFFFFSFLPFFLFQALNAPDLFTFGEVKNFQECQCFFFNCEKKILEVPSVVALRSSDDDEERRHYHLLQLFAFETMSCHASNASTYGPLNNLQTRKLRQLSIVSLSARQKRLAYDDLKEELRMYDVRELEDLILDTIYLGLVGGKLDSKNEFLCVDFAIGRDVKADDLEEIQRVLAAWQAKASALVETIDRKVNEARGRLQSDAMERAAFNARVRDMQEEIAKMTLKEREKGEKWSEKGGRNKRDFGGGGRGKRDLNF